MINKVEKNIETGKMAAILTWCDNNGPTNYGQILQCYAMQNLVDRWGYDSFVVQYRTRDERDFGKRIFSNRTPVGRLLNSHYEQQYNLKIIEKRNTPRVQAFKEFIKKYIRLTPPCYSRKAVEYETKDCSLLVCGSDQIWNPLWVNPIWLLDFGTSSQRRVAYAPSGIFDEDEDSEACYRKMVPLIEKLDVVTVREQLGVDILSKYTDKVIQAAPDPTLLMSSKEWDKVCAEQLVPEDYIFCYVMGSIRPHQLVLRKLLEKYNAKKIVYIPSNLLNEGQLPYFVRFDTAGPAEFISLIKHAKAVCTDSFHGTALSLIYGKQFYTVQRVQVGADKFGGAERTSDLLKRLHMDSRTVRSVKDVLGKGDIDYEQVDREIEMLQKYSTIENISI